MTNSAGRGRIREAVFVCTPDDPHGAFSNLAKFGVALDGAWWSTAEHVVRARTSRP